MDVLFVHPNFPGQFRRVAGAFARLPGLRVFGLGDETWMKSDGVPGVNVIGYPAPPEVPADTHGYARSFDAAVRRGEQVIRTLARHKNNGLEPDVIFVHPGWGDGFFLRDFFPGSKVVGLFEYFYHPRGADVGFDPEFPGRFDDMFRLRALNATQLLALDAVDAGFSPTEWQRSRYPAVWREHLSVLHEGIDTAVAAPDPAATVRLPDGAEFRAGDEVLTYVSRNLEPYRGYHVFMRALPEILRARPDCHVVIVGGDGVSYSPKPRGEQTWRETYLQEVADRIDTSRVHFTGSLPYDDYLKVLQVSRVHAYLTYPFILSWSMLEAMAAGCVVLGSATAPVEEVLVHGRNGLLFPFRSHESLASQAIEALADPERFRPLREEARRTILERYDFETISLPAYRRFLTD